MNKNRALAIWVSSTYQLVRYLYHLSNVSWGVSLFATCENLIGMKGKCDFDM